MSDLRRYTHGHHAAVVAQHARRSAESDAAYLLPYLRRGQALLDIGCGPGSITRGLARRVAPGITLGIDLAPEVVARAREDRSESLHSPRFMTGDVYGLGFADASFDVVHAHQVLQHLERPVDALREIRRVLRPAGVVAVRDADYSSMQAWPKHPAIERWRDLYCAVARRNATEPDAGRSLRSWLSEAGFESIRMTADAVCHATPEAARNWGESWAERVLHSNLGTHAQRYDLATKPELESIAAGWREWAHTAGALFYYVNLSCLARKPVVERRAAAAT